MDLQLICEPAQLPWQSITGHIVGFTNSARQRAKRPSGGKEFLSKLPADEPGAQLGEALQADEPQQEFEAAVLGAGTGAVLDEGATSGAGAAAGLER